MVKDALCYKSAIGVLLQEKRACSNRCWWQQDGAAELVSTKQVITDLSNSREKMIINFIFFSFVAWTIDTEGGCAWTRNKYKTVRALTSLKWRYSSTVLPNWFWKQKSQWTNLCRVFTFLFKSRYLIYRRNNHVMIIYYFNGDFVYISVGSKNVVYDCFY